MRERGWFESFRSKETIDSRHRCIPWYTYPAIEFLEPRLTKEMELFEYGCGNSTIWYAKKVRSVISVEHDQEWFDTISQSLPRNAELVRVDLEGEQYASEILRYGQRFDIVVIDGRDRIACVKFAIRCLKEDGILIFDNSERTRYSEAFAFLASHGYKKLDFVGIGPINPYSWTTSIFYKDKNCLGI